jgi:hypothetical protein
MLPLKTGPGHSCYVVAAIAKRLRGFFHGFVQSRRDSVKRATVSLCLESIAGRRRGYMPLRILAHPPSPS